MFNFFKKKHIEPKDNRIILSINDSNQVSIVLEIESNVDHVGTKIGQLLYRMNSGELEGSFADMLVEFADKNPEHNDTIQKIIVHWITAKNEKDNSPYISPIKVFAQ